MELEMDIEDLLNKRKLESDRIEFKTGGENPDDIYNYGSQDNKEFKANIDKIMITDGPYTLNGYPEKE